MAVSETSTAHNRIEMITEMITVLLWVNADAKAEAESLNKLANGKLTRLQDWTMWFDKLRDEKPSCLHELYRTTERGFRRFDDVLKVAEDSEQIRRTRGLLRSAMEVVGHHMSKLTIEKSTSEQSVIPSFDAQGRYKMERDMTTLYALSDYAFWLSRIFKEQEKVV